MGNKDSKPKASEYTSKYDYSEDDINKLRRSFDSIAEYILSHIFNPKKVNQNNIL